VGARSTCAAGAEMAGPKDAPGAAVTGSRGAVGAVRFTSAGGGAVVAASTTTAAGAAVPRSTTMRASAGAEAVARPEGVLLPIRDREELSAIVTFVGPAEELSSRAE
jgi:hypothetical protein